MIFQNREKVELVAFVEENIQKEIIAFAHFLLEVFIFLSKRK